MGHLYIYDVLISVKTGIALLLHELYASFFAKVSPMVDPFYTRKSDREESLMSKAMDLPLRSNIGHPSAFPLDSPSKQHSSLEESIDNAVSAHTPTINPINVALQEPVGVTSMSSSPMVGVPPLEDMGVGGQPSMGQSVMDASHTSQPKRLHVSNIPFRFRENDLRALFAVSAHLECGTVDGGALYVHVTHL